METLKIVPKFRLIKGNWSLQFKTMIGGYWMPMDVVYDHIKSGIEIDLRLDRPNGAICSLGMPIYPHIVLFRFLRSMNKFEPENQIDAHAAIMAGGLLNYIKELESGTIN